MRVRPAEHRVAGRVERAVAVVTEADVRIVVPGGGGASSSDERDRDGVPPGRLPVPRNGPHQALSQGTIARCTRRRKNNGVADEQQALDDDMLLLAALAGAVQLSRAPYRASTPASEFLPDQEHLVVISAASGPAWCRGEASRSPGGPRVLCGPGRAVWGPSEPERRCKTPTETGRPFGGRLRRSVGRLELFWLARGLTWTGDTGEHPLHLTRRARGGTP